MTFIVTYRDRTGSKRDEAFEATNRAECVAKCRAKGISPLAIKEGCKGSLYDGKGRGLKGLAGIKWGAFAVVTLLSAACLWLFFREGSVPPTPQPTTARASQKSNSTYSSPSSRNVPRSLGGESTVVGGAQFPSVSQTANPSINETTLAAVKALPPPPTNRTFKTTTEQVLGHVFTTRLGDMPFPVPRLPDEELAKIKEILERDVPLKDSDDAHVLDTKETVAAAKKEFAMFLSEGGKPEEFLPYYHEVLRKAFEEYSIACNACEKVKEEQPEIYKEFLDTVNRRLAAKGIKQVTSEPDDEQESVDTRSAGESDQKTKGTQ